MSTPCSGNWHRVRVCHNSFAPRAMLEPPSLQRITRLPQATFRACLPWPSRNRSTLRLSVRMIRWPLASSIFSKKKAFGSSGLRRPLPDLNHRSHLPRNSCSVTESRQQDPPPSRTRRPPCLIAVHRHIHWSSRLMGLLSAKEW